MENTLENKEKFFALYWGQEVLKANKNHEIAWVIGLGGNKPVMQEYLELKPLSSITDEDAIEVVKLKMFHDNVDINDIIDIKIAKSSDKKGYFLSLEGIVQHKRWNDFVERVFLGEEKIYSFYIDFLRSKGYALPYMGLIVEKLIEYGWVKLK